MPSAIKGFPHAESARRACPRLELGACLEVRTAAMQSSVS